ncbi:MAG: hypothetical protein IPM79_28320 [Polyangiaceae bacterium]|jgi:hypothetical protein|nr:hypothetical protein [Polyangiaceae bacterium]MBK8941405.1 hypothetical protein [Polyangiaceae bacterium]
MSRAGSDIAWAGRRGVSRGGALSRLARGVLPLLGLVTLVSAATISCATSSSMQDGASGSAGTSAPAGPSLIATAPDSATPSSSALPSASAARAAEVQAIRYADLVNDLSEPDTYFFSDNLISNETSYLQTAEALAARSEPPSVYVGVGPEQNFSYIALTKPSLAFVVDIRRANMLIHLLYRASFEEAADRAEFLALLAGRPTPEAGSLAKDAGIDAVFAAATKAPATEASYQAAHSRLMKRIEGYGVKLSADDKKTLSKDHATFHKEGLELRFELHSTNGRRYPTLRELLETKSPSGKTGGYLATDEAFRVVQKMQKEGRIVPLVGDFAGDHALPQLAQYLTREKLEVGVFYVSNVEQYLLEPKTWAKWLRNVKALPKTSDAVFVRAYLDQGKPHPKAMKGHRTTTVLSKIGDFEASYGNKPTASFFALCTENTL